jgi:hypothetical protein
MMLYIIFSDFNKFCLVAITHYGCGFALELALWTIAVSQVLAQSCYYAIVAFYFFLLNIK